MKTNLRIAVVALAVVVFMTTYFLNSKPSESVMTLKTALSVMEGVGEIEIYIHYPEQQERLFNLQQMNDSPIGVLVIAEGADHPFIKNKLRQTVASVLQIAEHRVIVEPMEGDSIEP